MNEIIPLDAMKEMARTCCASKLFGIHSPEEALSLMLLCQADGIHPMKAMRKYHIIQGRPAMRAEAMLADFQSNGGKIQWIERTDEKCSAKFSHPSGGELVVEWTIERAKKAGLAVKEIWRKFPAQMLSARVISEGVRAVFPAIVCGVYTPEEIEDFSPCESKSKIIPESDDYENVIPIEPEETKVVPVPLANPAVEHVKRIQAVRKHLIELGCSTAKDFEEITQKVLGKSCSTLSQLNDEELSLLMEGAENGK